MEFLYHDASCSLGSAMTSNDTLKQSDGTSDSSIRHSVGTKLQSLNSNRYGRIILRMSRVALYIFGIWTIFLYYWSFLGILIGIGIAAISSESAWRRHGLVLSYSSGLLTGTMAIYAWLWILLLYLILIVYLVGSVIHLCIRLLITGFRRILGRQREDSVVKTDTESWISRNLLKRLKTGVFAGRPKMFQRIKLITVILVLVAPFLIWSTVNLDFGVMFDNNPTLLWVYSPSTVDVGEEFDVVVEAWDSFERLSASYQGTVEFSIQSYNLTSGQPLAGVDANFSGAYTFTGSAFSTGLIPAYLLAGSADYGLHSFPVQINTIGIHYILVEDSLTQNIYWSNPIIVDDLVVDSPRIYWGDLHGHSAVSDGSGTPAESYYFGRNIAKLDFMSLTDHGEHLTLFDRSKIGTAEFQAYLQATAEAYVPGEFVSFFGVEWTTNYVDQKFWFIPVPAATGGHYTCVFSGDSMPLVSTFTENTAEELWAVLDDFTSSTGAQALAIPHHTVRSMFIQDWTLMNPNYVKLVEVTSVHGECLYDNELNYRGSVDLPETRIPGSSVIDAINMGYRMTFMANGDNHDGRPGHSISHTRASAGHQYPFTLYNARNGHPYPSGITAVYASGLTRDDVFTGLENGRIYASSDFGRPILDLTLNGVSVGYNATVTLPTPTSSRTLSIFIAQDGTPAAGMNRAATAGQNWVPDWTATVEIIKNGEIWQTVQITTPTSWINVVDDSVITGTSYNDTIQDAEGNYYINERSENPIVPSTLNTGGSDYYTIRIVGANGRTSYIGPIWVNSP
ncbi:MAG: DUF3604 domain-containing protein [Candidatus Thorarchaeota archaeon]